MILVETLTMYYIVLYWYVLMSIYAMYGSGMHAKNKLGCVIFFFGQSVPGANAQT